MRGQLDAAEKILYGLTATTESQRRFADQHDRAVDLLAKTRDLRNDQQFEASSPGSLSAVSRPAGCRLFPGHPVRRARIDRQSASDSPVRPPGPPLFAAPGREEVGWQLAPLPESLSSKQQEEVGLGCYEMLMVLAEAVARPLPDESAMQQARKALEILDRAVELRREPTRAVSLADGPPACNGRTTRGGAARELRGGRARPAGRCVRSFLKRPGAVQQRPSHGGQAKLRPCPASPAEPFLGPVLARHLRPQRPAPATRRGQGLT